MHMIQVGLLITHQYRLLSVAAILDVFETVNKFALADGKEVPFQIILLHPDESTSLPVFGYSSRPLGSSGTLNLVLIPSFTTDDIAATIHSNNAFIPWLTAAYRNNTEIATFCTGAFLLAATGLLNGKIATTCGCLRCICTGIPCSKIASRQDRKHRMAACIRAAGPPSTFHLLLHLVHHYCSREMSIKIAKIFAIDMDRETQAYFSTFQPSRNHTDELVATAQQKIESNYHDTGTIEEMIRDIPASRRNMVRRFKQVTGITPIEYLQQTRIEAAKKLLLQTSLQMTEVIYNTGYNDPKAFRKVFRKSVGMTPSEYREKFQVR